MEEHTLADVPDSECLAYGESLRESGRYVAAEALESTATTVRSQRQGVADRRALRRNEGQLAGFYLIDAKDLDDAIEMAAKIPPARVGAIEVRPVRELSAK